jgi:hypothetical protein
MSQNQSPKSSELQRMLETATIIDLSAYKPLHVKVDELFPSGTPAVDRAMLLVAFGWGNWSLAHGTDIRSKQAFINAIAGLLEQSS